MDELGWVHRVDLSSSDIHTGPISVISADSTYRNWALPGESSAQVHVEDVVQALCMAAFFLWV